MAKFLFLASGGKIPASDGEGAKLMKAWEDWFAAMGSKVVDPGSPLSPVAKIASDGRVKDVPAGAMVNGYMILNAESREEAIRIAQGCPSCSPKPTWRCSRFPGDVIKAQQSETENLPAIGLVDFLLNDSNDPCSFFTTSLPFFVSL